MAGCYEFMCVAYFTCILQPTSSLRLEATQWLWCHSVETVPPGGQNIHFYFPHTGMSVQTVKRLFLHAPLTLIQTDVFFPVKIGIKVACMWYASMFFQKQQVSLANFCYSLRWYTSSQNWRS